MSITPVTSAYVPYTSYTPRPDVAVARDSTSAAAGTGDRNGTGANTSTTATISNARAPRAQNGQPLSDSEQREVTKLAQRDDEVRAHEAAHVAAGGSLITQGASYTYTRGPDGRSYAVGGEVSIDTSQGKTPEETLQRAEQIRRAALAPAAPSSQDRQVAAEAARMAMEARSALAQQRTDSADGHPGVASAYAHQSASNSSGSLINEYA